MTRITKAVGKPARKAQALVRDAEYAAQTPEERLASLDARPGKSTRERDRLGRLIVEPLPAKGRKSTKKVKVPDVVTAELEGGVTVAFDTVNKKITTTRKK